MEISGNANWNVIGRTDVYPVASVVYDNLTSKFRFLTTADLVSGSVGTIGGTSINTSFPSGVNGNVLFANPNRKELFIQNLSTGSALYVKFGELAHFTNFSAVLKADSTLNDAGNGGQLSSDVWKGIVSVSGDSSVIRYIAWELV